MYDEEPASGGQPSVRPQPSAIRNVGSADLSATVPTPSDGKVTQI